jgi:hypothetical protein
MSPEGGGGDGDKPKGKVIELDEVVVTGKMKNKHRNPNSTEIGYYDYAGTPEMWEKQYGMKADDYTAEMEKAHDKYCYEDSQREKNRALLEKLWIFTSYFYIAEDVIYINVASVALSNATKIIQKLKKLHPNKKISISITNKRLKKIDGVEINGNATAIGRMEDLKKFDKYSNVDTWHKSGRMPGPNDGPVTWPENRKWLDERITRGDTFIMTMDPKNLPTEYIKGSPNGWFTKLEYDYLVKKGATIIKNY